MMNLAYPALATWLITALAFAQDAARNDTVRVTGRLVTADGAPVAGAAVALADPRQLPTATLLREPQFRTGEDGRFTLATARPDADSLAPPQLLVAAKGFAAIAQPLAWPSRAEGQDGNADADAGAIPVPADGERALGDVVMVPGVRMVGRVRDRDGKPVAGAFVEAVDLLDHRQGLRASRPSHCECTARSDAAGIFDLPAALPNAMVLRVLADGHYAVELQPVHAGSPIEVTLQPSGLLQGRVLDADGHGLAAALVSVAYEGGRLPQHARSEADGSFRFHLLHQGRWRITATAKGKPKPATASTEVRSGPAANLELIARSEAANASTRLPLLVVAKGTGQPVDEFRAVAVFEEYANQSANYRDYRLRQLLKRAPAQRGGRGEVDGPGEHGAPVGAVRITAPGFATTTRTEVDGKEPENGAARDALQIELVPESTAAGVLRDEATGAPVAGAKVYARQRQDPNQGIYDDPNDLPADAVTSAADGSFLVRGLGEGAWDLVVRDPRRPRGPAVAFDLAAEERKTGLTVVLPSGATVAGRLCGTAIGPGWRVFLSQLPRPFFGDGHHYFQHFGGANSAEQAVAVDAEGRFRFDGVPLDHHMLVLRVPSAPRLGGDLFLPIESLRVRRQGVQRDFECGEDRPATIRGKVTFPHAAVPFEQLLVVARFVPADGQVGFSPFEMHFPGPRAFVDSRGEFAVRVGPGHYHLTLVDLATGLPLHQTRERLAVPTGGEATCSLAPELAEVAIELAKAADIVEPALVERLELRLLPKELEGQGNPFDDNYDTSIGLDWPAGQSRLVLALPAGKVIALARSHLAGLRQDDARWNNAPLGRAECEVATGGKEPVPCRVEIGAPPEIPAAKDGKGDGAQDAQVLDEVLIK